VFNAQGRVVGVLWGTDGEEVVGVQAGRLHVLLDEAAAKLGVRDAECGTDHARLSALQRIPTPPKGMDRAEQECLRNPLCGRRPSQPATQVIVQPAPEVRRSLGNIDAKVGVLIERQSPKSETTDDDAHNFSPLAAGLCILAAVVIGFWIFFAAQKSA